MTGFSRRAAVPAALLSVAGLALVHATLLRTEPAADAALGIGPTEVRLWFSEAVEPAPDPVVVTDATGRRVDRGGAVAPDDPTELRAPVDAAAAGSYSVRWRAVSDDGHVVEGTYAFHVGREPPSGRADAEATPSATVEAQLPLLAAGRALHLLGLALALGALTLLLLDPSVRSTASVVRRVVRLGDVGAVTLVAAAAVMLVGQSAAMQGSLGAGLSQPALREAIHSRWADAWTVRAFAGAALLFVFGIAGRAARPGPGTLAAGVLAAVPLLLGTSVNGHAATTPPAWLSVGADVLHLAATAAWLGGGLCLAALLRLARRDDAAFAAVRSVVPRFSALGLLSVQVLIVTGLYQAWAHLAGPQALTTTGYGRTLLLKLALFALMAIPAAANRFVIKPRLAATTAMDGGGRAALLRRFSRLVAAEAGLGVGVLACAALLSALPPAHRETAPAGHAGMATPTPPPRPEAEPPAGRLRQFAAAGDGRSVILSLDPGGLGSNRIRLALRDAGGRPDASSVALRAVPPDGTGLAPTLVRLSSGTSDHTALLALGTAGAWTIEVLVDGRRTASFRVDVRP